MLYNKYYYITNLIIKQNVNISFKYFSDNVDTCREQQLYLSFGFTKTKKPIGC